jgi:hypothetical protein
MTVRRRRGDGEGGRGDAGTLFVESIIAAAVVAMVVGAAFRVIADGASRDRSLEIRRAALLLAESELAAVGSAIPLREGQSAGRAGDMLWSVDMAPYDDGIESSTAGALWRVAVAVRARPGAAPLVRMATLRLGPRAE